MPPWDFIGVPGGAEKAISGGIDGNFGEMAYSTKIEFPIPAYFMFRRQNLPPDLREIMLSGGSWRITIKGISAPGKLICLL